MDGNLRRPSADLRHRRGVHTGEHHPWTVRGRLPRGRRSHGHRNDPALDDSRPARPVPHRPALHRAGRAEIIAGYATEHFRITADNRLCADVWLSGEALEVSGIRPFLRALRLFHNRQQAMFEARGIRDNACDNARQAAMERYEELGLPLRIQASDGIMLQEVVRLQTNVKLDPARFHVPTGYEFVSAEDLR